MHGLIFRPGLKNPFVSQSPREFYETGHAEHLAVPGQEEHFYIVLEQPPIPLILLHVTTHLKLKGIIKRTCFEGVEAIKRTIMRGIPEESFQQYIEAWQRRKRKLIRLERDYFEGETL